MEWNGMEWNGMEWNGMEWNGMEWNRIESSIYSPFEHRPHCFITQIYRRSEAKKETNSKTQVTVLNKCRKTFHPQCGRTRKARPSKLFHPKNNYLNPVSCKPKYIPLVDSFEFWPVQATPYFKGGSMYDASTDQIFRLKA